MASPRRAPTSDPSTRQPSSRPGRLRIFLPTVALCLVLVGVGLFWTYATWRAGTEIDAWMSREASLGRTWTCPDRKIAGFPFRIEVSCSGLSFKGNAEGRAVSGTLGSALAVAQIYNPNHVIVEFHGPLTAVDAQGRSLELVFALARASIMGRPGPGLERYSMEITEPRLKLHAPGLPEVSAAASMMDFHIRRTPDRPPSDGSYDVASMVQKASIPLVDAWLGGNDLTDLNLLATITRAEPLVGRGLPEELERWRTEGGRIQLSQFTLSHGRKRVDAAGTLGLDDLHRAQGRLDLTVAGLDELLQSFGLSGRSAAIGGLIAGVLGGRKAQAAEAPQQDPAGKGMMLPLRLDNGKVLIGPIAVATLLPLY